MSKEYVVYLLVSQSTPMAVGIRIMVYIRTVAYVRKNHPSLVIIPRPDIWNDLDVQVLQIQTAGIPTTTLFNIYNQ